MVVATAAGAILLPSREPPGQADAQRACGAALGSPGGGEAPYLQFLGTKAGTEYQEYAPAEPQSICGYAMLHVPRNTVIDFAQDARDKMRHWGVAEEKIGNILFTHSHFDHYDPPTVLAFAQDRWQKHHRKTHAFASATVFADLQGVSHEAGAGAFLTVTEVASGDRVALAEDVAATVLPSSHWTAPTPVHYLLEFHGREILYAVDAAAFRDGDLAALEGHRLEAVVIDCTYLADEIDPETSGHMNYSMVCQQMTELKKRGLATDSTRCYLTHMVPVDYSQGASAARELGLLMAYDGLRIPFR